jgi:hypothetical protein
MDEMTLLHDLGHELAPAQLCPPESLRAGVLARGSADLDPASSRPGGQPWRAPALVLAAASVTVALVLAPTLLSGGRSPSGGGSAAAAVLDRAAQAAEALPTPIVPVGSFVFTDGTSRTGHGVEGTDPAAQAWDHRSWRPARNDGSDILMQARKSGTTRWGSSTIPGDTREQGGYRDDLPTTTAGMLRYLYGQNPNGNPVDGQAFQEVEELISGSYLPPAAMAALFRAAGRIPGTIVIKGRHDALGRPAIAVAWDSTKFCTVGKPLSPESHVLATYCGNYELLFDPVTFTVLGAQTVLASDSVLGPKGTVVAAGIGAPPAIVSRAGELAPSTAHFEKQFDSMRKIPYLP